MKMNIRQHAKKIIQDYEADDWMNRRLGPPTGEYDQAGAIRRNFTIFESIVLWIHRAAQRKRWRRMGFYG